MQGGEAFAGRGLRGGCAAFCVALFSGIAVFLSACSGVDEDVSAARAKASSAANREGRADSWTLSQRRLLDIVALQNDLFADPNADSLDGGALAEAALRTKAMRIDSLWKTYFLDFPDDSEALIIYGKFLRRIGRRDSAYDAFKRAAALAPDAAVAYQQMSALEAESGMSAEAFAHIRAALKIEPDNEVYLRQTAYILVLAKKELVGRGLSTREFDALLSRCYRRIFEKNPADKDAKLRYAQSFYDLFEPDYARALALWREIRRDSALNIDRQTASANIARVLVELNRDAEAEAVLREVDLPQLMRAKKLLLSEIERAKNVSK